MRHTSFCKINGSKVMRQMEKKITAMRKYLQPMAALLKNRRLNSARTGKGKKVI